MIMNEPKQVDLIDRIALLKSFDENCAGECAICLYHGKCKDNIYCELIANAPSLHPKTLATVTFDENKLKEFVEKAVENFKDSILPDGEWVTDDGMTVCSVCGGWRRDNRVDYIAFCNRCGARMKKEV